MKSVHVGKKYYSVVIQIRDSSFSLLFHYYMYFRIKSCSHALRLIVAESGIKGLWRGWVPNVQRAALVNCGGTFTPIVYQPTLSTGFFPLFFAFYLNIIYFTSDRINIILDIYKLKTNTEVRSLKHTQYIGLRTSCKLWILEKLKVSHERYYMFHLSLKCVLFVQILWHTIQ